MSGSMQADLPLPPPAGKGRVRAARPPALRRETGALAKLVQATGTHAPKVQPAGNRRTWPRVLRAEGAQQEGRALAARKTPRTGDRPKPAPARDLLTYVALADVSPEVREALASFGRAIEAGFLARQQRHAPRQAWWNRD